MDMGQVLIGLPTTGLQTPESSLPGALPTRSCAGSGPGPGMLLHEDLTGPDHRERGSGPWRALCLGLYRSGVMQTQVRTPACFSMRT